MDGAVAIRDLSTGALVAELARRHGGQATTPAAEKPACSSGERGAYDTPLHVFALILILGLSTLSCAIPLLTTRHRSRQSSSSSTSPPSGGSSTVIFFSQHFGTGVLIATAFVHLLPTAFTSLTDPCLPDPFTVGYRPLAGLVAMVAALAVVAVESWLSTRGAGHSHAHSHTHHHHAPRPHRGGWEELEGGSGDDEGGDEAGESGRARGLSARRHPAGLADIETRALVADASPLPGLTPLPLTPLTAEMHADGKTAPQRQRRERRERRSYGGSYDDDDHEDDDDDSGSDMHITLDELEPATTHQTTAAKLPIASGETHPDTSPPPPSPEEQHRLLVQCLLLEAGILFHSVFIGMALSVATGPTFLVFLVAISFHQSFEGLALGSRIAAIRFPRASARPWLMVLAYGATTPLGQAIGLIVHNMYDPRSAAGLLMVGFMNAISSGLLLFAGLVQLLAEDFLSERSYEVLRGRRRRWAFCAVAAGAGLMALVGAFA